MQASTLLFITSFIPTVVFKTIARMGNPTVSQAKLATVTGLGLAVVQILVSRRVLKQTTYLERAFLGFLAAGALWVFIAPPDMARFYVAYNTTLLYSVLFLTTLVPQLLGFDPFTYTIAKQWQPEPVWKTPQFKTINHHITRVFAVIMFLAAVFNFAGHGRPFYAVALPLIMIIGVGIPFARIYPKFYLARQSSKMKAPVRTGLSDTIQNPDTIQKLMAGMPAGFSKEAAGGLCADIQYIFDEKTPFVLSIKNGTCSFRTGHTPDPDLTIHSPARVWMKMAKGETDPIKAFMEGVYKADGDMDLLMKLGQIFRRSENRHKTAT